MLTRSACRGRGSGSAYAKVDRRVGDWAVAAAGAALDVRDGAITYAGLALAAVGGDMTVASTSRVGGRADPAKLFKAAAARSPPSSATRSPTSGAPRSTSATSPAS